jgi:flagellar motility protein MotE (MotC chaperone)
MKRLLLILVLGLTMFGASAGVSVYLRRAEAVLAEKAQGGDASESERVMQLEKTGKIVPGGLAAKAGESDSLAPPASRPTQPTPDSVAQLAGIVRQQQETLRAREQQLQVRQKHLDIIHQDLRNERASVDEVRQQVNAEMKALTDKIEALERKSTEVEKQKQKLMEQNKELKQTVFEVDNVEQKSFKRMATTFDSMDADTAAELLQQMADSGKMDMAVKIVSTMQERQAARVLAQMQDRGAVVQILDRMKGLKRPSP